MKKFLAVFFSVLFVLSSATVAFAGEENLTCDTCFEVLETKEAYNKHVAGGGCLISYEPCQYCKGNIAAENHAAHELICPDGAGKCEFCGKDYANQAAYATHKESECKVTTAIGDKVPVATIFDKIVDALKGVDWGGLVGKIGDLIGGIDFGGLIAKIKPILEKVVEFVKGAIA